MEKALIIFVENSEHGVVKGKLTDEIGGEKGLQVHNHLLQKTRDITIDLHCNHFIFYSHFVHVSDIFDDGCYTKFVQEGNNTLEKLHNAFNKVFALGCEKICLIGSEAYELDQELIEQAFELLNTHDIILGPSGDSNYYLIGTKVEQKDFLYNKVTQGNEHTNSMLDIVKHSGTAYHLLPQINIIDTYSNLL
jgi:glycosyltransferase A (GT-A) superfamily protein (DUF2064 family)